MLAQIVRDPRSGIYICLSKIFSILGTIEDVSEATLCSTTHVLQIWSLVASASLPILLTSGR